jgi:hypothetical protein
VHFNAGGSGSPNRAAACERQLRQTQKSQQAAELTAAFDAIENLHRQEFAQAAPPVVTPARGDQSQHRQYQQQQHLNEQWRRLLANDPAVAFAALTKAFDDNEAPAAVAGFDNGEASIVVVAPEINLVPDRMPGLTPAGNLSLARIAKEARNSYYLKLVCGHALLTVREALAVAPGLQSVRIAVVRPTAPDAYGIHQFECLLAGVFARQRLRGVQWQSADSFRITQDVAADVCVRLSATHEMLPLDLAEEPWLAALLQVIDARGASEPFAASEGAGSGPVTAPLRGGPGAPGASAVWPSAPGYPGYQQQAPSSQSATPSQSAPPAWSAPSVPPGSAAPSASSRTVGRRRTARGAARAKHKPAKALGIAAGAFVLLLIIVAIATSGRTPKQAGDSSVVATTSTQAVTQSRTPAPNAKKQAPSTKTTPPEPAESAVQPTTPAPAATTPAAPPPSSPPPPAPAPATSAAAAPASCTPLTNGGNCYEPGEFCRAADHGTSGVAGDGKAIICEDNDGWRWEPV